MTDEASYQATIEHAAQVLGWKSNHTRRSVAGRTPRGGQPSWTTATSTVGYPDLHLWHPNQRRHVFAEIKGPNGRLRRHQREVLRSMPHIPGVVCVHVWRPKDWDRVVECLQNDCQHTQGIT